MKHRVVGLVFTVFLTTVFNTNCYSDVVYKKNTYSEAQIKLDHSLSEVPKLLSKKVCRQILRDELGWNSRNQLVVPFFIIDDVFFGIDPVSGYLDLLPWDNNTRGNNVCAELTDGSLLNYINIDGDVLLVLPVEEVIYTVMHETVHAIQCQSHNIGNKSSEELHDHVTRILDVCYPE